MDAIRTTEWEGIRLAWREGGRGPVLVLLHGWGASARFWEPAVARLAGRFRCLALDWPGYGRSGRPGRAVGLAGHAAALEAFLRRVAGPGAVVVGHSMGGSVAAMAAAAGAPMGRLVLVAPLVRAADGLNRRSRRLLWPGVRHLLRPLLGLYPVARWIAANSTFATPIPESLIRGAMAADRAVLMGDALGLGRLDLTPLLPRIERPVLLVWGRRDAVVRPAQQRLAASLLPRVETLEIPRCGHCPPLEAPDAFAAAVGRFGVGPSRQ